MAQDSPLHPSLQTVVLTSRQNFVWHSMQEIIPWIEAAWKGAAGPDHRVLIRDIDQTPLSELVPLLLQTTNIVLTCFNARLGRLASLLRKDLRIDARFIIYLHNQATIACWPLHAWGLAENLREDDVFISSCSLDAEAVHLSFEQPRVELVPFGLPQEDELPASAPPTAQEIPFAYVGRISEQKNLHTLLYSARLLKSLRPRLRFTLDLFGGEDNLGSPNMGMESTGYLAYLSALRDQLGLQEFVRFRGHQGRDRLYRELGQVRHIFISPSLHSDENFGMAAFRSLCTGNLAILSAWGGHKDFVNAFPGRVFLVNAQESEAGPFISTGELGQAMAAVARAYQDALIGEASAVGIPARYRIKQISTELARIARAPLAPGAPLRATRIAERIVANRARFIGDSPRQSKIFESYGDPEAHLFLRAYGMRVAGEPGTPSAAPLQEIQLLPWAEMNDDRIEATDPHRGRIAIPLAPSILGPVKAIDARGNHRFIGTGEAKRILRLGLGNHMPPELVP